MQTIYLDHNATTSMLPEVIEAMAACDRAGFANPASQHQPGRRARQALEEAREGIAALLGANLTDARPDRLIFTSGGTEANNLAIFGLAGSSPQHVIVSAIEHPSVLGAAEQLRRVGWQIEILGATPQGIVDQVQFQRLIQQQPTRLVSVMLGNNETGVLQPISELADACAAAGTLIHTDAVQVAGKLPVSFRGLRVGAMSIAAHKFHGPRGIGALIVRDGVELQPRLFGGFQQAGLRPGTESVSLAVGMHTALCLWTDEQEARRNRMCELRDRLERRLVASIPGATVHGCQASRLPHVSQIAFPGLNRQALVMALDLAGIACSTGSACASGSTDPSSTLVAMGCPAELLESSVRFSLGATTTSVEIDIAVERILAVCRRIRGSNLVD